MKEHNKKEKKSTKKAKAINKKKACKAKNSKPQSQLSYKYP